LTSTRPCVGSHPGGHHVSHKHASICFFNNKGGVGKTTLACNVAAYIAQHTGRSVLVVDADPQCNATQLILPDEFTEQIYRSDRSPVDTLKDVLQPMIAGDASLAKTFRPATPASNRFGVHLLPGHPQVAVQEDLFSTNWTQFLGGSLGGARVTNWNTQFLASTASQYDLVIYDVGPSLGALNRCILIGVDYFVAPMGCDIFSLIGIENIADWLKRWRSNYDSGLALTKRDHPNEVDKYEIRSDSTRMSRFLGYTVQQYITKTIRSERRATGAYEAILSAIPSEIDKTLAPLVAPGAVELHLGDVPHMFSLVPLAQTKHTPIQGLVSGDGLSGGQYAQQKDYERFITALSRSLLKNLDAAQVAS